jgi:hypothetical protein
MATSPLFGWEEPDDTDLVKDGAAAIRTLGNAIDTSMGDLLGGTTGQVLSKNSNTNMDFTWITNDVGDITSVTAGTGISGGGTSGAVTITNSMATAITTAGDLIKGTGSGTFDRLGIGSTGQVLTVASGAPSWATPASGSTFSGVSVRNSGNLTLTNGVTLVGTFDTEDYDTDGYHSTVSNTSRLTVPTGKAGKYQISCIMSFNKTSATGQRAAQFVKNGTIGMYFPEIPGSSSFYLGQQLSWFTTLAEADYIEVQAYQNSGGNLLWLTAGADGFQFAMNYLGA